MYQVYDISGSLKEGENELFVILGDGWYRGNNGIDGTRNLFGTDLSLLAEIYINDRPAVLTDDTWDGSMDGPILLADLELGEIYDARREKIENWHKARILTEAPKPEKGLKQTGFGYDNLVPTKTLPVREQECLEGYLFKTPDGSWVYDFGQNLAGVTRIQVWMRMATLRSQISSRANEIITEASHRKPSISAKMATRNINRVFLFLDSAMPKSRRTFRLKICA